MPKRDRPFHQLERSAAAKALTSPMRRVTTGFSVDFSSIPDPTRTYYAQDCWVEYDREVVGIFFAQKRRDGEHLRSLVCIRMASTNVISWLKHVELIESPSVAEVARIVNATPERLTNSPRGEADQTFEASSNVVRTGISGLDATLDFMKFSPFDIQAAKNGLIAKGSPLIRVELRSGLFLGLIAHLTDLSESFPPLYKELEED